MLNSHKTKSNTHTLQFMFAQNNCSFWPAAKRLLCMTQLIPKFCLCNDPIAMYKSSSQKLSINWLYAVKLTFRSPVPTLILHYSAKSTKKFSQPNMTAYNQIFPVPTDVDPGKA